MTIIHYAEVTSFIRTLLIIFFFYYLIKFLFRYILPIFLTKQVNKMKDQQRRSYSDNYNPSKEGETSIDKKPNSKSGGSSKKVGEYVDFEEID